MGRELFISALIIAILVFIPAYMDEHGKGRKEAYMVGGCLFFGSIVVGVIGLLMWLVWRA